MDHLLARVKELFQQRNKKPVKSYQEYADLQKDFFCSYESEHDLWKKGQTRFINRYFKKLDRKAKILDIACGDGVGLQHFKKLGFTKVVGVEFNKKKAVRAKKYGFPVYEDDMHNLDRFKDKTFDAVYSSHTLEHAFDPEKATSEIYRILKKGGQFILVLPYPDNYDFALKAHVGKYKLGTHIHDEGEEVVKFFERFGFTLTEKTFDSYRQPEIWLILEK